MSLNQYLLARELGNPLGRGLELYRNTRMWHTLLPERATSNTAHPTGINALDIEAQQSRQLLSGGADGSIAIWDLERPTATLEPKTRVPNGRRAHRFGISSIIFYPSDPGLFVSSSYDRTVKIWDATEMSVAFTFNLGAAVNAIAMAPRAYHTLVAVSLQSPTLRLLDLNTGGATHTLVGHTEGGTFAVNWSPRDEHLLASGGADGTARLWDVRMAASCLACLDMNNSGRSRMDGRNRAHEGVINGIAWTENGAALVTFGHDEKLRVWDLITGRNSLTNFDPVIRNRRQQNLNPVLTPLRQSDPQIVFIPSDSEIVGFHIKEGNVILKQKINRHKVNALVRRPNQPELYYASTGGEINVLGSFIAVDDDEQGGAAEETKTNVLDTIYRSLVQTPITFT